MIATSNIPLNVPFKEKDEAKSHGARWNPAAKHWYIPEGVDDTPFAKWLDGAPAASETSAPAQSNTNSGNLGQPTQDLPKQADMDDINAMLRNASEVDDNFFIDE